ASDLKKSLELKELILLMGTDMNKELIQSVGLFHASFEDATPNDLLIAAHLNHEIADFKDQILESLSHQKTATTTNQTEFKTLNQAYEAISPNMAVISV